MILRKYNYRLETGTVGTDDDNIASILYNINRMEMNVDFETDDDEELEETLGQLFFMVVDTKVHLDNFLEIFGEKINADTAAAVIAVLDGAIEDIRAAREMNDKEKCLAVFPKVYKKLLDTVPSVLALDAQAVGRASGC